MAVTNAFWEGLAGFQLRCSIGASILTGSGTGASYSNYFNQFWQDNSGVSYRITKLGYKTGLALAAGSSATIDLTALDSPDGSTGTVSMSALVVAYIAVTSSTGQLTIGNAASNGHPLDFGAASYTRILLPNGPGHLMGDYSGVGYPVSGSSKNVKVLNSHGSQTVDYIAFFGGQ
jgi:hypothetical protein